MTQLEQDGFFQNPHLLIDVIDYQRIREECAKRYMEQEDIQNLLDWQGLPLAPDLHTYFASPQATNFLSNLKHAGFEFTARLDPVVTGNSFNLVYVAGVNFHDLYDIRRHTNKIDFLKKLYRLNGKTENEAEIIHKFVNIDEEIERAVNESLSKQKNIMKESYFHFEVDANKKRFCETVSQRFNKFLEEVS